MSFQWLGFIGTSLVVAAYLPQIAHLVRARCTAGVSLFAYSIWSVASALLLTYAIAVQDAVFISPQGYQLTATLAIFILSRKNHGNLCDIHCGTEPHLYSRA